jgi:hypothetical protein
LEEPAVDVDAVASSVLRFLLRRGHGAGIVRARVEDARRFRHHRTMTSFHLPSAASSRRLGAIGVLGASIALSRAAQADPPPRDGAVAASDPTAAPAAAGAVTAEQPDRETAAARLQSTLDYYADRARQARTVGGATLLALGAVGAGTGIYLLAANDGYAAPGIFNTVVGGSFMLGGALVLLSTSKFEDLAAADRQGANALATEQAWARAASSERSLRRFAGVFSVIGGGVVLAFGAASLFDRHLWGSDPDNSVALGEVYIAEGGLDVLLGMSSLAVEGPIESSWHAYQRSSGQAVGVGVALLQHVRIGPTRGGAQAGFVMGF